VRGNRDEPANVRVVGPSNGTTRRANQPICFG